jgi:hypothetical protein
MVLHGEEVGQGFFFWLQFSLGCGITSHLSLHPHTSSENCFLPVAYGTSTSMNIFNLAVCSFFHYIPLSFLRSIFFYAASETQARMALN